METRIEDFPPQTKLASGFELTEWTLAGLRMVPMAGSTLHREPLRA
jgi:hypothetical protein